MKEYEDEFFVRHALVLDTFTERLQSEEFEEAVSVAASFACTIRTQESEVYVDLSKVVYVSLASQEHRVGF